MRAVTLGTDRMQVITRIMTKLGRFNYVNYQWQAGIVRHPVFSGQRVSPPQTMFDDQPTVEQAFNGESDRAIIVLQAGILELVMDAAIKKKMRKHFLFEIPERLLGCDRPVGSLRKF